MDGDEVEIELLAARVDRAIHQSHELIHRSSLLKVQTTVFLNQLKSQKDFYGCPMVQAGADFLLGNIPSSLNWVVSAALQITKAEMGNLQLVDPASGNLYIAAQYGFRRPFLEFFECVHENQAACGTALKSRGRIIVEDITESPIFRGTPALEVLLDAGVRALQSTPLIGGSGFMAGVISTHWSSPHRSSDRDLFSLDLLASNLSDWLDGRDYLEI
jgi:hypothetical protein